MFVYTVNEISVAGTSLEIHVSIKADAVVENIKEGVYQYLESKSITIL